jgi:hypothetical protein
MMWGNLVELAVGFGLFVAAGATLASVISGFRTKRRDDTIEVQNSLISSLQGQNADLTNRVAQLEGRMDMLTGEFAAIIADAVVRRMETVMGKNTAATERNTVELRHH